MKLFTDLSRTVLDHSKVSSRLFNGLNKTEQPIYTLLNGRRWIDDEFGFLIINFETPTRYVGSLPDRSSS